ncbi:MAG: HDOD domain-containing protein, partial [Lentisphaerae bacterium]|nr:HDOD domain-containing protein [Lentisphaerota bacterium]
VGIATNVLYQRTKETIQKEYSPDTLHLCGLLHDIGKIFFEQFFHEKFEKALVLCVEKQIPLFQAEQEVFGMDHTETGFKLTANWNLSREVSECIRFHHEPEKSNEQFRELVRLVHTANYIVNLEKLGGS